MIAPSNCITRILGVLVIPVDALVHNWAVDRRIGPNDLAPGAYLVLRHIPQHLLVVQRFRQVPWVTLIRRPKSEK